MASLFNVLYQALSILRGERNGTATGGSATTLVDTALAEANDYLNGGTLFIFTGNNASKSAVITDWASATFTFTFPTLTLLCAAGDQYAAFDNRYTRAAMVQAVNRALADLNYADQTNEATTTTADTASYALPSGVANVVRVQIATSKTSPYNYAEPRHDWVERNGYLFFDNYYDIPVGYLMRITYQADFTRLATSTDATALPGDIRPERLAAEAAYWAAYARNGLAGSSDPETEKDLALAVAARNEARARYPMRNSHIDSRYISLP